MASDDKQLSYKDSTALERLHYQMMGASELLDAALPLFDQVPLDRADNVREIGIALGAIFTIEAQIYKLRPDLMPTWTKPEWNKPADQR